MAAVTQTINISTHVSAGTATVYSGIVNGRILGIKYMPGTGGTQIATGADLTFTTETTEQAVLVKSNAGTSDVWFYPRILGSKSTDGASTTFFEYIWAVNERIKLVLAEGGNSKVGSVMLLVDQYPQS